MPNTHNTHTEVPTTPQLALPNNGHLQPTPDVTVLVLKASTSILRVMPLPLPFAENLYLLKLS